MTNIKEKISSFLNYGDQIIYTGDKIGNEVNKTIYTGIVNLNTNNIYYDLGDSKTFNDNSISKKIMDRN